MKDLSTAKKILLAAVVLLAAWLVIRGFVKHVGPTPEEKSTTIVETAPSNNAITIVPESTKNTESVRETKKRYIGMMRTGLSEIPGRKVEGGLQIKVKIKVQEMDCSLGDFDFIKGAIDNLHNEDFLLSLEPLHKGKSIKKRLSLSQMLEGGTLGITLPETAKALDYGVYLCFDFKRTNECGAKPLLAAREWKTLLNSIKTNDRIFYYQMITSRENHAYLIPSFQWDNSSMQTLKNELKGLIQSESSIDTLKSSMQKLRPIPARLVKGVLELPLPSRSSKCL